MNCVYHAEVPNVAFCIRCGHALCNECVRNVRGSVYCETCLAEAVEGKSAAAIVSQIRLIDTRRLNNKVGTLERTFFDPIRKAARKSL